MSVITFINRDRKENGQTFSVAAIATCMAIEHNYKILLISTDFDDRSMEECFTKSRIKECSLIHLQNKAQWIYQVGLKD